MKRRKNLETAPSDPAVLLDVETLYGETKGGTNEESTLAG